MKAKNEKPPISFRWWLFLLLDVLVVVVFGIFAALNGLFLRRAIIITSVLSRISHIQKLFLAFGFLLLH
jgi:hypothetical protein